MEGTFVRSYVSKKGNDTFVYTVTGTPAEIAAYKTAQGENYRADDKGAPLFFTTRVGASPRVKLITTQAGNVIIDNSEMKAAANLAAQYGGNLGQEIARNFASQMSIGSGASVSAPAVVTEPVANLSEPDGKKK